MVLKTAILIQTTFRVLLQKQHIPQGQRSRPGIERLAEAPTLETILFELY